MRKISRIIICVLLPILIVTSSVSFAALSFDSGEYTVVANDYGSFARAVSEMTVRAEKKYIRSSSLKLASSDALDDYISKRIIVKSNIPSPDFSCYGAVQSIKGPDGLYVLQFDSRYAAENCVNALNADSSIKYAEPDYPISVCEGITENISSLTDEYTSWGAKYIEADIYSQYLIDNGMNTAETVVAVLDTGISPDASFLDRMTSNGYDYVDNDSNPESYGSHGTHVGGIISDCTKGLNIKLMSVRVLGDTGSGYLTAAVSGIYYAADNGADVINYSIDGSHSDSKEDAVAYASANGVSMVCAAGNGGKDIADRCPAHIESAIVTGAVNESGERWSGSSFGGTLDVVAPGVSIISCGTDGGFATKTGTSMATGFVSAGAAMYRLSNPGATVQQTEQFIKSCCEDLGEEGFDVYYGNGQLKLSKGCRSTEFNYTAIGDKREISKYSGDDAFVALPEYASGYAVVSVGNNAFHENTKLKTVVIPEGITSVGDNAFYGCASLMNVSLPVGIISIGDLAFYNCPCLNRIVIPPTVTDIGYRSLGFRYDSESDSCIKIEDFTVRGYKATAAEVYAVENGFVFEEINQPFITVTFDKTKMISGESESVSVEMYPISDANSWTMSSSSPSAVEVNGDSLKAVGSGNAVITVSALINGITIKKVFAVRAFEKGITLNLSSLSMIFKEKETLTVTVNASGYSEADISFTTDNPDIVRVGNDGMITALKKGSTTVKAATKDGKYSALCSVSVEYTTWQWIVRILFFGWIWDKA